MPIIDTHCHLNFPDFDRDRDAAFERAAQAGVAGFINVATRPEDWQRCLDLAEGRPSVRVALGIHPHEAGSYTLQTGAELKALAAADSRVVAIGETGLDFFRDHAPRDRQFEAFRAQLDIAAQLQKPVILHCRAAETEMLEVLEEHSKRQHSPLRGVWHCFTSTQAFAARAVALGLYFGLGGIITYPKATELREAAADLPADRLLLETDCPFLPPPPWRGQRNEPAYLVKVAEMLAQIRKTTVEEIAELTTRNAQALFRF